MFLASGKKKQKKIAKASGGKPVTVTLPVNIEKLGPAERGDSQLIQIQALLEQKRAELLLQQQQQVSEQMPSLDNLPEGWF